MPSAPAPLQQPGSYLSRRSVLQLGSLAGLTALVGAVPGCAVLTNSAPALGFKAVPLSDTDAVIVPVGYTARVLFAWGDPISNGPPFKPDASNSAGEQAQQAGMHHDGMHFFPLPRASKNSIHGLLAINHEYLDQHLLFADGLKTWAVEKLRKAQNAVGVSIIEVRRNGSTWQLVRPSKYARRITAQTPMSISGPARGSALMKTAADPDGIEVLGTHSNCANGFTPWGTYLTCEEGIAGFFAQPFENPGARQARYGLRKSSGYRWPELDERFNADRHPNEFNRFGWVVEIDPFDPASKPVKRSALGRCAHENSAHAVAADGRVVIYTGDDGQFEYIYKFVSRDVWNPRERAANRDLLDHGTLYVGNFSDNGSGSWIALVHGQNGLNATNGFSDQADVLVYARLAGDQVGATKMDRPEWIAVHPQSGDAYASLTNNTRRGAVGRAGLDNVNPRNNNIYGHILRWRETGGDAAALTFTWDIFALAGDPAHPDPAQHGNINGDAFGCPDSLTFSPDGMLWICTDTPTPGRGDFAQLGNNQLLAADTLSGEIRRFMTAPRGCETAGLSFTPDGKTAFLNIQHPGEVSTNREGPRSSNWPSAVPGARPRSATIAITKDDGGRIGS